MVVPSFSIQNFEEKFMCLSFYQKDNKTKILGVLKSGIASLSVQLMGVQENCVHVVTNDNSLNNSGPCLLSRNSSGSPYSSFYNNIPTKRWVISLRNSPLSLQQKGIEHIISNRCSDKFPDEVGSATDYTYYHDWYEIGSRGEMLTKIV